MRIPGKFPLSILIGLGACTWIAVAIVLYGAKAELSFFKPLSIVTTVLTVALAGFDRLFWRLPWMSKLHGVPNLNGTWTGHVDSTWVDPKNGKALTSILGVVVVRQTYTSLYVRMFTAEQSSMSVAAGLEPEADGRVVMNYLYRSEPQLSIRDRSQIHYGGVRLALGGEADELDGSYWTDRNSKGELKLRRISRVHAADLKAAERLTEATATKSHAPKTK